MIPRGCEELDGWVARAIDRALECTVRAPLGGMPSVRCEALGLRPRRFHPLAWEHAVDALIAAMLEEAVSG